VNDDCETHPGFRPTICGRCGRPVYMHHEKCLVGLLAYFDSLSRMQRALDLAISAGNKGAVLHWRGRLP